MNREQYFAFHKKCCDRMTEITKAKNMDYAGAGGENPFANFSRVKAMGICEVEQGFLVRMTDKLSRIASIVASGKTHVKDESIQDTLLDLANYCLLMLGYLESLKESDLEGPPQTIWDTSGGLDSLDHPCKQTCSGWKQGRERGVADALAFLESTNMMGWEIDAGLRSGDCMLVAQRIRDALKDWLG